MESLGKCKPVDEMLKIFFQVSEHFSTQRVYRVRLD